MKRQAKKLPSQEELHYLYYYNPETGKFYARFKGGRGKYKIGRTSQSKGRKVWKIDGQIYKEHRLIWVYVYGDDPGKLMIDHKDCNEHNNKLDNLRLADENQNARNRSGSKGIKYIERTNLWVARIRANGKEIHLGTYDYAWEAHDAYCDARIKYFGEFAPTK